MCLDEYIPHQILYQVWIFYVELWLNIFKARSMKHDETDFDFVYKSCLHALYIVNKKTFESCVHEIEDKSWPVMSVCCVAISEIYYMWKLG